MISIATHSQGTSANWPRGEQEEEGAQSNSKLSREQNDFRGEKSQDDRKWKEGGKQTARESPEREKDINS